MVNHSVTISPKAASGNGDLDGFSTTCSCGDRSSWTFESMAKQYAADHAAYMARVGK